MPADAYKAFQRGYSEGRGGERRQKPEQGEKSRRIY
jgi:hypothetical protein